MRASRIVIILAQTSMALALSFQARAAAQTPASLADCQQAYWQCFAAAGFLGYFFCPQQYSQCVDQVRSQLTDTLGAVNECRSLSDACQTQAGSDPEARALCSRQQTTCVLDVFGVQPSPEAAKDVLCVDDAMRCLDASEQTSDLARCAASLRNCVMRPVEPL